MTINSLKFAQHYKRHFITICNYKVVREQSFVGLTFEISFQTECIKSKVNNKIETNVGFCKPKYHWSHITLWVVSSCVV